jgi:uncharacterized protein
MNSRTFPEIMQRFAQIEINEPFDCIVAIANGGLVPAGILNQRLQIPVEVLRINFKDDNQQPRYETPKLLTPINFEFKNKRILLVDDRIKSGKTIVLAKELLREAAIVKTFAVNGIADYALFNESCFRFPWFL